MRDASFVACVVQALLGLYFGVVLRWGAKTASRRLLARVLLELGAYAAVLAVFHATPVLRVATEAIAVGLASMSIFDLLAFALWTARGADDARRTIMPPSLYAAAWVVVAALVGVDIALAPPNLATIWPETALFVAGLLGQLASVALFAVAMRRGVKGGRGYFFTALWPLAPLVLNLADTVGLRLPSLVVLLVRDLSVLAFQFSLLTTYLNDGQEPMSLRDRIVSGVLMAVASFTTAVAQLILPPSRSRPRPGRSSPRRTAARRASSASSRWPRSSSRSPCRSSSARASSDPSSA